MVAGIFYNELFDCKKGRESIAVFLIFGSGSFAVCNRSG